MQLNRRSFLAGAAALVAAPGCMTGAGEPRRGVVCFTFDDRNFAGWLAALPLFRTYAAHATFFTTGPIDAQAAGTLRQLQAAGHSLGLHSLHHADAPEYFAKHGAAAYVKNEVLSQLEPARAAGLVIHSFAYPNNLRDAATDAALSPYFWHFRAGIHTRVNGVRMPITRLDSAIIPFREIRKHRVMEGFGIGEYYATKREDLLEMLRRTAAQNGVITFFSHNIAPAAKSINMPTETLEACLREASALGMSIAGFDELPCEKS